MNDLQNTVSLKRVSALLIICAGCLWGTMGIFVRKWTQSGLDSMEMVSLRSFFTAVMMFIFLLIYDKKLLRVKLRDLWCFFGTGICSILFFSYCYFAAINITSLALSATLLYTAPSMVTVMSAFLFKERFTLKKALCVMMAFAGCMLVTGMTSGKGPGANTAGILFGLGSGFGYALYSIFGRYALTKGYNTFTILLYTFVFAAVGSMFFCDVKNIALCVTNSAGDFIFAVVFVLVTTAAPYLLYTFGLKNVENSAASVMASAEPVVAAVIGAVLYKEQLGAAGITGAALVLASTVICNITGKNTQIKEEIKK